MAYIIVYCYSDNKNTTYFKTLLFHVPTSYFEGLKNVKLKHSYILTSGKAEQPSFKDYFVLDYIGIRCESLSFKAHNPMC